MYALWIKNTSESDARSCEVTKGAVSATPLFLFTSGNDKLNCSKSKKHQKLPNHQEEQLG